MISLRLEIYSRIEVEAMGGPIPAIRRGIAKDCDTWRWVKDLLSQDHDSLIVLRRDPDAAEEPPGYETLYCTGTSWNVGLGGEPR